MSGTDGPAGGVLTPERVHDTTREPVSGKDFVYCAICSTVIARVADRIEVNGSFDHVCTNPHGVTFHLGCFGNALGCTISGDRMAADTWFPGFRWRIATCGECSAHLGWYFDREETTYFYGLILNRIQYE
ncbi:MAG: hypothetical protein H6993_11585 [Pseudomonadales bacterium]|nr:hypothetical protein [Pseudomonadales bacterium]MCP5184597.1 hypothetical protein [Pseudomonadales bacterium]